jgi:hypothetical protein
MGDLAELLDPPGHQRTIRLAHLQGRNLRQREIDRFRELGIPALQLGRPWMVLANRVVFDGEFFAFADDIGMFGEDVFTIPVFGNAGMIDIAAWHPKTDRLAVWCGEGFALGEGQIRHPIPLAQGLPVFRTPIGWLRARRCGIVISRRSLAREILGDVPLLIAEDEQHRSELKELLGLAGPDVELGCVSPCRTAEVAS